MVKSNTPRRSRSLVDPEVQGSVLKKITVHWFVLFLCNSLALVMWVRLFEQPDAEWAETLRECFYRYLPFLIVTIALVPAFVWDTLKLTNRFAGPILRLRQALADVAEGRAVTPLHFRQNDFWREIAENFNITVGARTPVDATNVSKPTN
jgi:hypothetical protein